MSLAPPPPPSGADASPPPPAGLGARLARVIGTGFGFGYSPLAPGTAGSLLGLLLYWPLAVWGARATVTATVLVSAVGVWAATRVARQLGRKDPGQVVVDEIAGQWVSLLFLPWTPAVAVMAFLAFRAMDIVKPWPARQLEALPEGIGIMADDLMAGVYANLLVRVGLLVLPLS